MFLKNKYTKWYSSIIATARSRSLVNTYFESHHILIDYQFLFAKCNVPLVIACFCGVIKHGMSGRVTTETKTSIDVTRNQTFGSTTIFVSILPTDHQRMFVKFGVSIHDDWVHTGSLSQTSDRQKHLVVRVCHSHPIAKKLIKIQSTRFHKPSICETVNSVNHFTGLTNSLAIVILI